MDLNANDGIQIGVGVVLALTLLAVVWYACETRKQAKATVKLAEASMRPVVDLWIDKITLDELKSKPLTLHYKNFGNGPAHNLEWKADPEMREWEADGVRKDKVTRVGMGVHDNEANIQCFPHDPSRARFLMVEYEDISRIGWRTTLKLTLDGDSLGNGKTIIDKIRG
jgi:hypothetical protein